MNTSIASMRSALANKATELATLQAENERLRELVKEYIYLWEHEKHHLSGVWYGLYIATKDLESEE